MNARTARTHTIKKNKQTRMIVKDIDKQIKMATKHGCSEIIYPFQDNGFSDIIQKHYTDKEFGINKVNITGGEISDECICKYRIFW